MIHIYTETFELWAHFKRMMKRAVGRSLGGPKAVEQSLVRGLTELQQEYFWNKPPQQNGGSAVVLSGKDTLRWAIEQKGRGKFNKLIAGPNIAVTPLDDEGLILSSAIDAYVVPAQWSVDWWVSLAPEMKDKLKIWPAGVEDKGRLAQLVGNVLVFQKNAPESLFSGIVMELEKRGEKPEVVRYGRFTQPGYLQAISRSKYMVYLSQSESQGLSLHEAWMAGVPTLVWNRGYLAYEKFRWNDAKISAPYLTDQCGMFFYDEGDFDSRLSEFTARLDQFRPREYSLQNFTDRIAARKLLALLNSI